MTTEDKSSLLRMAFASHSTLVASHANYCLASSRNSFNPEGPWALVSNGLMALGSIVFFIGIILAGRAKRQAFFNLNRGPVLKILAMVLVFMVLI